MKLLSFNVARVLVALLFVFSTVSNIFAVYIPPVSDPVCAECNRASGHETWCPYYRGSSTSGSSKSSSSGSSYTAEKAMIEATSMAVGAALASLFSTPAKTPEQIAKEEAAKAAEQAAINAENAAKSQEEKILLRDEQFWDSGDYVVKEGDLKFRGGRAYGIYNKRTKRWVLNPNKKGNLNKNWGVYRKVKKNDNYWIRKSGNMRILSCKPAETSTTDQKVEDANKDKLVWMYYGRKYDEQEKYWNIVKEHKFFSIDDNDELKELKTLKTGYKNILLMEKNGKVGIVLFLPDSNVDRSYKYGYYGYEIEVPAEYDSIDVYPNLMDQLKDKIKAEVVYTAKKQDSVSILGCYGKQLASALSIYDTITSLPNFANKSDIFAVSKNNKFGAVNSEGQVIVPAVYDDVTTFCNQVNDILPLTSFTIWCTDKVKNYVNEKGKYEKEADYQARMNDQEKQKQYVLEKMEKAGIEYTDQFKDKITIELDGYDAEAEKFIIKEYVNFPATKTNVTTTYKQEGNKQTKTEKISDNGKKLLSWNKIELAVPIKEAEEFEKNFKNMTQEALKNATYGIQYDIISISKITFTMPDGKTYTFDSTKQ